MTSTPHKKNFPKVFIVKCDSIWHGTFLWSICISCPYCVHSRILGHPQPTHCKDRVGNSQLCNICSAIFKSMVCFKHCFSQKSKPSGLDQHHQGCSKGNYLNKTQPGQGNKLKKEEGIRAQAHHFSFVILFVAFLYVW